VRRDVPWSPDSPPYTPHSHEQEEEQFSEEEDLQIDEAAELVPPTSPQEQTVQEQEKNETEDLFKDALQFIEDDLTSLLFSILDGVIAEEGETTAAQNRQVVAVVEPVQAIEEQSFTFDTLKIPLQLYMTAHNAKSTTKAASVLFFGLFNAQELKSSTLSGKVGRKGRVEGQMLDPVKLLAIERLVSHMKRTNLDQLPTDDTCCSEIPPLTPTEISEIEKAVYTQEKSQKRARHCNTVDNVSKNGLIVSIPHCFSLNNTLFSALDPHSPPDKLQKMGPNPPGDGQRKRKGSWEGPVSGNLYTGGNCKFAGQAEGGSAQF